MIALTLAIIASSFGLVTLWLVIGITQYDLRNIRIQSQQARHPHSRQYKQRPAITTILHIDHDVSWLQAALTSLRGSHYRKLEIILIFPPNLSQSVKHSLTALKIRSSKSLHLYENRQEHPMIAAKKAYQRFGHGDLIITLDSTHIPASNLIASVVSYFNQRPDAAILHSRTTTVSSFRILGLLQQYNEFIENIICQAFSGLNITPMSTESAGHIYRESHFIASDPVIQPSSLYSSDIVTQTPPVESLSTLIKRHLHQKNMRLQTLARHASSPANLMEYITSICLLAGQIGATIIPLLVGYFIFMAVQLHQPFFLMMTLSIYFSVVLFAIWKNKELRLRQKIGYVILSPITLLSTYLSSLLTPITLLYVLASVRFIPVIRRARETI